eukprot:TRINITY_DN29881_c0_g1_i1.p1 TRINITY_DN29881_c0_g1~~TRINITY_DN29881_c0_g1_i1.p1  ORF type:complete len:503 (+),score=73.78 TRINITY_DN29881_c0_g1_i1:58-1566(+)
MGCGASQARGPEMYYPASDMKHHAAIQDEAEEGHSCAEPSEFAARLRAKVRHVRSGLSLSVRNAAFDPDGESARTAEAKLGEDGFVEGITNWLVDTSRADMSDADSSVPSLPSEAVEVKLTPGAEEELEAVLARMDSAASSTSEDPTADTLSEEVLRHHADLASQIAELCPLHLSFLYPSRHATRPVVPLCQRNGRAVPAVPHQTEQQTLRQEVTIERDVSEIELAASTRPGIPKQAVPQPAASDQQRNAFNDRDLSEIELTASQQPSVPDAAPERRRDEEMRVQLPDRDTSEIQMAELPRRVEADDVDRTAARGAGSPHARRHLHRFVLGPVDGRDSGTTGSSASIESPAVEQRETVGGQPAQAGESFDDGTSSEESEGDWPQRAIDAADSVTFGPMHPSPAATPNNAHRHRVVSFVPSSQGLSSSASLTTQGSQTSSALSANLHGAPSPMYALARTRSPASLSLSAPTRQYLWRTYLKNTELTFPRFQFMRCDAAVPPAP